MSALGPGPEFDLIRNFLKGAPHAHPLVRVGPGDDCAIVGELAISTDVSVENVHFRRDWLDAEAIGWRAAAAALSDLAAVGATPVGVLVSCVLHPDDAGQFGQSVMRGVIAATAAAGGVLLGGDVARGEQLTLDVVAVGSAQAPVLRRGAAVGDELWVTGALGGAAAAVRELLKGAAPPAAARVRYTRPQPRIREALWLRQHAELTALIDLSDGLYGDAAHLAAASGCAVVIDTARVPIDQASGATLEEAIGGGEDYELCFSARAGAITPVEQQFEREFGLMLTRIGEVREGAGVLERDADGSVRAIQPRGYQHFGERAR